MSAIVIEDHGGGHVSTVIESADPLRHNIVIRGADGQRFECEVIEYPWLAPSPVEGAFTNRRQRRAASALGKRRR